MTKPEERFSDRVADYIKYRPDYPPAIWEALRERGALEARAEIADMGSGTGISTRMLLERGYRVHAVEPNAEMREAAESALAEFEGFTSVPRKAEDSGLPADSMDAVVCAQAFHWFDRDAARREFARVIKPGGLVGLVWNARLVSGNPFLEAYEELLLERCPDYAAVNHQGIEPVEELFSRDAQRDCVDHAQHFDWDGLAGRVSSSSYVPAPQSREGADFREALRDLFDAHQASGRIVFRYETQLHSGRLD